LWKVVKLMVALQVQFVKADERCRVANIFALDDQNLARGREQWTVKENKDGTFEIDKRWDESMSACACEWCDSPSSPLYFSPTFHTPHFLCTHSCLFFPPSSSLWSNQRSDWRVINWFESNIFIKNINSITVVKLDLFGNLNTEFDFCCLNFAVDRIWAQ
jgi:hypothetical protein